jgi:methyl-accepting chemotaxis protein
LKRRFRVDLSVHVRDGDRFKALASTFAERTTATTDELDAAMRGATLGHDAAVGGHPAAVYLGPIKSFAGEPVAVLELVRDTTAYEAAAAAARRDLAIGSFLIVLAALGVALVLARSLSRPVLAMTRVMKQLATGDTAVTVPGRARRDELGTMAEAVEVFRVGMIETDQLRAEQEVAKQRADQERREALHRLADELEGNVRGVASAVEAAAAAMQTSAQRLNGTAERTSAQSAAVSTASEEASANVQTIATATEELANSITEVGQMVEQSTTIIHRAAADASRTDRCIQSLAEAAEHIGGVVKLITEIASQTNLLALNATIEAARAGDAGRGFAVVASEVKALAGQTAKATDEIASQVAAIQSATREAVDSIHGISGTIAQVDEISVGIASAIQQQGAATQEISRNGQHAAAGTRDVTTHISGVSQATGDTRVAAGEVLSASGKMTDQSAALSAAVDGFLAKVRSA